MFVKKDNCRTIEEVVRRNTGMETEQFLTDVRDPFLKNLKEAVEFVKNYISSHPGCRVTIVGDYDSDGINATTIMYWCFMKMKITPVLRLPRRMSEGYGLNEKIIDEIPSGLLITVDNGIAALAAVKKAKEKNLAVVVTDHHLPVQDKDGNMLLPEADVILDPHIDSESDFHDYCGAALAYRFARAMFGAKFPELIVLASIAAVSDVVPLIGANRTLVKDGLGYINKRRVVPGLAELLKKLELDDHITEGDYGFLLGPIFNASGRLFDSGAENVVKLLCTKRGDFTAKYKADKRILDDINVEPTREYIDMAHDVVTSDIFMKSFGNLSERNVWIENELDDFFYSKPVMIKRIVNYIVETGIQNTSNGNWTVCTDEVQEKFDVTYEWLLENRELIKDSIDGRDEILSATWDSFDGNGKWNGFDCNFCGDSCPNYEE